MAEVPQKVEEKIFQSSGLNQEAITIEYGITSPSQSDGNFYSLEEMETTGGRINGTHCKEVWEIQI